MLQLPEICAIMIILKSIQYSEEKRGGVVEGVSEEENRNLIYPAA